MAWSGLKFNEDSASRLIVETGDRLEQYRVLLPQLKDWALSERVQKLCPDFPEQVEQLLTLDGQIMSKLYHQSCYPHLEKGDNPWRDTVVDLVATIPEAGVEPEETVEFLINAQRQTTEQLAALSREVQLVSDNNQLGG